MADILLFACDYTKALDGLLRVLNWRKVAYGKDYMKTLTVVQRVGTTHLCLGQLREALPYLIEAADGYITLETHPDLIVTALKQVADTAKRLNRWTMAEKYRLRLEGFTGKTPTPLNRSNIDLTTITPQFGKTNVIFGLFTVLFIIWEVCRSFQAP